jgi:hypothetical protein
MSKQDRDLETISIPDIEITDGWSAASVQDLEECNDAFAYLMAAVAEIEYQLEQHSIGIVISPDPTWKARAGRALKYKRAALQLVGYRRGELSALARQKAHNKRDRALLDYIKSVTDPKVFHQWVIGSGVETAARDSEAA